MALTGAQYQAMRLKFRGLIASPFAGVSEAELDNFMGQLLIDATGSVTATQKSQADSFLASALTSPGYTAQAADVGPFLQQLQSAAPIIIQALVSARYQQLKNQLTGALSIVGIRTEAQMLAYLATAAGVRFANLFPGAFQIVQTNLGMLYGSTPLATAGNTATTVLALSGVIAGVPVPIWAVATNSLAIGSGGAFNIYYDGAGVTAAMTGVVPTAGVAVALTGAGAGLSITWTAGTVVNGNSWKACSAGLTDQSGNGKDYTQGTLGTQPLITAGVNGMPGLLFDGVDDVLTSLCVCPVPGVTPWSGFLVARRPTGAAANARMVDDASDACALILTGATSISLFNNGSFGPVGTGLPTNTWGAIDYKFSNSAADYIQTGSGPAVSGAGAGNAASTNRSISNGAAQSNIEVLAGGYMPATLFNSATFRNAVTTLYGATVNV